jgi:hypothetical protein
VEVNKAPRPTYEHKLRIKSFSRASDAFTPLSVFPISQKMASLGWLFIEEKIIHLISIYLLLAACFISHIGHSFDPIEVV